MATPASATPAANTVVKALGTGKIAAGWLDTTTLFATIVDSSFFLVGNVDATKRMAFQADTQGAGFTLTYDVGAQVASRILSAPVLTADATLAVLSEVQTFSGAKTFSAATTVSNATASTSSTTGALVNAGGFGNAGAIFAGGNITATAAANITVSAITTSTTGFSFGDYQSDLGVTFQAGTFGSARAGTTFGLANANLCTLYTAQYGATAPSGLAIGTNNGSPLVLGTNTAARLTISGGGDTTVTGGMASTSPTVGVGYATGAGGTVTQITSKTTGVVLNKVCGTITLNNAAMLATTSAAFTLTNSAIAATDVVVVAIKSGATASSYSLQVDAIAAGSCSITIRNYGSVTLSEAVVISFVVIKAVAA